MADQQFTIEELESEEWRPVVGFEGVYEVSCLGRMRRLAVKHSPRGHMLSLRPDGRGYRITILQRGPRKRKARIHQFVAAAFIGPLPSPKHEVNHRDGVRSNNRLANLEYVTRHENMQHARDVLHRRFAKGEGHGNALLTALIVQQILAMESSNFTQAEIGSQLDITKYAVADRAQPERRCSPGAPE